MRPTAGQSVWNPQRRSSAALEVYLLGTVDFDSMMVLQDQLVDGIAQRSDRLGTVVLCEHPPTLTVGLDGRITDLPLDTTDFTARMMKFRRINRTGGTLIHVPGQIAAYVMLPLERMECDYPVFRQKLVDAAIETSGEQRVPARCIEDLPGAACRCGQFSWIGTSVRDGVSCHGLFLNVASELRTQRLVRSTADGRQISSLSMQKMQPVPMHQVRESLIRHLASQFGYDETHPYTGHPLLKRTIQKVIQYV